MSRFLSRMAGGTVEKEMLMQILVESFETKTTKKYSKLFLEIARGDKKEKETIPVSIQPGESKVILNTMFHTTSKFFQVKDTGVFQEKTVVLAMYGLDSLGKQQLLGEIKFDMAPCGGKIGMPVTLVLEKGEIK